jgi:O-antigen ligase
MKKSELVKLFVLATVFFIPLYLARLNILGIPTNILEILAAMSIVLSFIFNWKAKLEIPKIYLIAAGMMVLGLFLSAWSGGNWKVSLGIIKGWFIFPMIFAYAILKINSRKKIKEKIIYSYFISAGLVSLISLIYATLGFFTYDHRLKGFYSSPNYLAMYLAPAVIIGLYILATKLVKSFDGKLINSIKFFEYYFLVSLFSLILAAFYLTYSYATWISITIALLIGLVLRSGLINNRKVIYLILITFLVLATQIQNPKFINQFSDRSSWQSRIMIWKSGLKIAVDNPVLGIGPGNFQNKYLDYQKYFSPYLEWAVPQPHNLYLAFWLESGIIGLFSFIIIIAYWLVQIIHKILKSKSEFELLLATIVIYVLLNGLFDTPVWKNDLAFIFWVIISLGIKNSHHGGNTN